MLLCPVCNQQLTACDRTSGCVNGHRFDLAREGYLNLLRTSRSGDTIGDDKQSARCRRDFLNKGYYAPLKDALVDLFAGKVDMDSGYIAAGENCLTNVPGVFVAGDCRTKGVRQIATAIADGATAALAANAYLDK